MDDLQKARDIIDSIDSELLALFIKRMEIVNAIGKIKKSEGKPIYDRKREEEVMQKISEKAPPHLCSYSFDLFKKIMELSKDYQKDSL